MKNILIVGNTNVGKSLLFNKLCDGDYALVYDKENTTLDYISIYKNDIKLTDTAGIIHYNEWLNMYGDKLLKQSDLILYVCDISKPITFEIENLFRKLHAMQVPIWIIVNKYDKRQHPDFSLHKLNAEKIVYVSCMQYQTIHELKNLLGLIDKQTNIVENIVAIVGRCNAGKSTLLNRILHENRSKVSEIAGTTVDHIRESYTIHNIPITFIDTPGFSNDTTDFMYTINKRRTNLLNNTFIGQIVLIDAEIGITRQDKAVLDQAQTAGLFTIVCINKYDLITLFVQEQIKHLNIYNNVQVFNISALTNYGIKEMLKALTESIRNFHKFSTPKLNKFLQELKAIDTINRNIKSIKYMVQTNSRPITILYFSNLRLNVNDMKCIKKHMMKYFNIKNYRILLKAAN